jgi:hypothetical protein
MVGGGGDEISYQWSFHTLPGLFAHLRYENDRTLLAAANVALFIVMAGALAFAVYTKWKKRSDP